MELGAFHCAWLQCLSSIFVSGKKSVEALLIVLVVEALNLVLEVSKHIETSTVAWSHDWCIHTQHNTTTSLIVLQDRYFISCNVWDLIHKLWTQWPTTNVRWWWLYHYGANLMVWWCFSFMASCSVSCWHRSWWSGWVETLLAVDDFWCRRKTHNKCSCAHLTHTQTHTHTHTHIHTPHTHLCSSH